MNKSWRLLIPAVLIVLILVGLAATTRDVRANPLPTETATPKPPDPTAPPGVTWTPEATKGPTDTPDPGATVTPTKPPPAASETKAATVTQPPADTDTPTPKPTKPTATEAPSSTPIPTSTVTPLPTDTPTVGPSATPSVTPLPTITPSPSPTSTGIAASATPTASPIPTQTASPTASITPGSPVPTATRPVVELGTPTPTQNVTPPCCTTASPTVTATEKAQPTGTSAPTPTGTSVPVLPPIGVEISGTVKLCCEGNGASVRSRVVGLIHLPSIRRKIPIGLGWVREGNYFHAINVAGKVSADDFAMHQKFIDLSKLRVGDVVRVDDTHYSVHHKVIVVDKNQAVMEGLLSRWATFTTCTADWKDNLVLLLRLVPERWK